MCMVVAAAAGVELEVKVVDYATKASPEHMAMEMPGKYPKLVCKDGTLTECSAIAKYLAHGTSLMPECPLQRAKMDQWLLWQEGTVGPASYNALMAVFGMGYKPITGDEFKTAEKALKDAVKALNSAVAEN